MTTFLYCPPSGETRPMQVTVFTDTGTRTIKLLAPGASFTITGVTITLQYANSPEWYSYIVSRFNGLNVIITAPQTVSTTSEASPVCGLPGGSPGELIPPTDSFSSIVRQHCIYVCTLKEKRSKRKNCGCRH